MLRFKQFLQRCQLHVFAFTLSRPLLSEGILIIVDGGSWYTAQISCYHQGQAKVFMLEVMIRRKDWMKEIGEQEGQIPGAGGGGAGVTSWKLDEEALRGVLSAGHSRGWQWEGCTAGKPSGRWWRPRRGHEDGCGSNRAICQLHRPLRHHLGLDVFWRGRLGQGGLLLGGMLKRLQVTSPVKGPRVRSHWVAEFFRM